MTHFLLILLTSISQLMAANEQLTVYKCEVSGENESHAKAELFLYVTKNVADLQDLPVIDQSPSHMEPFKALYESLDNFNETKNVFVHFRKWVHRSRIKKTRGGDWWEGTSYIYLSMERNAQGLVEGYSDVILTRPDLISPVQPDGMIFYRKEIFYLKEPRVWDSESLSSAEIHRYEIVSGLCFPVGEKHF